MEMSLASERGLRSLWTVSKGFLLIQGPWRVPRGQWPVAAGIPRSRSWARGVLPLPYRVCLVGCGIYLTWYLRWEALRVSLLPRSAPLRRMALRGTRPVKIHLSLHYSSTQTLSYNLVPPSTVRAVRL